MSLLDATHDPALRSWVTSANTPDTDFPVQNLPFGRFRRKGEGQQDTLRVGVAIGDQVLDLRLAAELCPWSNEVAPLLDPLAAGDLAAFMRLGRPAWRAVRAALSAALTADSEQGPFLESCLVPQADVQMAMPCEIGDYTDFYTSIHHATTVGKMFRPDNPLLPNYTWVPIGYHGRSSSIGVSGQLLRRPMGQVKLIDAAEPVLRASSRLDYELELGALMAHGNELGSRIGMDKAEDHIFGLVLFNDWSARDIQPWEYQPLGPFLSKNFGSTVSPWVVTLDALAPFRQPFVRAEGQPQPLPYLDSAHNREAGAISIELEVWLQTQKMQKAQHPGDRLAGSNYASAAYWTLAQLVAHHTVNGCNLRTGDLLGTGTLSGPEPGQGGSMLELGHGGRQALTLSSGELRSFIEDGDTVILRGHCMAEGARRIGFGECRGTVLPALT
ncbi:MAG: fumarylacetoacetase [Rubrivivax sp.]|nr:fumarylacetoacetase [Rubrivivax sp.]MDP3614560.1 fumarylacetoacetase [Rubrivivax sp.]